MKKIFLLVPLCLVPVLATAEPSSSAVDGKTVRLDPSRILRMPEVWFPITPPSELSPNLACASNPALGIPPLACQTITKTGTAYASFSWTGLSLTFPKDGVIHIPIYLEDFQAPGKNFSLSLTVQLTNAGGSISYSFSSAGFRAAGWTYVPIWNPATAANAVFSKPGMSFVTADTGFDFAKPVTAIRFVPNNLPTGATIFIASPEVASKVKPVIVITDDITDDSTYTEIVPIMESAGFRGGLRIGGARESGFSDRMISKLRKAYENGWDVYNGSWSRISLSGSTTREVFESEVRDCQTRARELGFTRGMTWFSSAGNSLPPQSLGKAVARELGLSVLKSGGGLGFSNITRVEDEAGPANVRSAGVGGANSQPAKGVRGESTIVITNNRSIREGTRVVGLGIGEGAVVAPNGVQGNTVTLTVPNAGDVAGPVTLTDSFEAHKALADGLIPTGGAIVYFMHDLKPASSPQSVISFPIEDFEKLVAYWKRKSDAGQLEIITPSRYDALMRGEK